MAVVLLAAFLMIACLLALRFEKQLTDVLPLATCILILILYVLAFFRRLSWIDYFSTAIVVGAVLRVLFLSGEKKKKLFVQLRRLWKSVEASRMNTGWYQVVSGSLRSTLSKHRCLDLKKSLVCEELSCKLSNLALHHDVSLKIRSS